MITDTFDRRTIAKMEVALERACLLLPAGSEKHNARRIIASKIIECANRGEATLSRLYGGRLRLCDATDCFRPVHREERGRQLEVLTSG